jgi:hypothetical protein
MPRTIRPKPAFTITVSRIGTPDVLEVVELYEATQLEAERRLSDVWNSGYCSSPGRFRARLRDAEKKICMTID